jgi:hypothetical protein
MVVKSRRIGLGGTCSTLRKTRLGYRNCIKLHKKLKPIRQIVNWKDSPGYKLAKHITTQLSNILQLLNTYNSKILLAEILIQYLEHTKVIQILSKRQSIDYNRYVDDILIVFNTYITNIEHNLTEFNSGHPQIKFTIEKEHLINKIIWR